MSTRISVKKPTPAEVDTLGAKQWPIWEKEPSRFDWFYDEPETCLFLEGAVTVHTADGDVRIGAGDLVSFPQGLKCTWEVTRGVRKHYKFG